MKHVDHIINEKEVLQYLSDMTNQQIYDSPSRVREESDSEEGEIKGECPFIMDIYSSFQDKENLYFELEYI